MVVNFTTTQEEFYDCLVPVLEAALRERKEAEKIELAETGGAVAARIALEAKEAGAKRDTRKPLSSKEAAFELGYKDERTIQEFVRKGKLNPIGKSRNYKFTWNEIERFKNAD